MAQLRWFQSICFPVLRAVKAFRRESSHEQQADIEIKVPKLWYLSKQQSSV